MTLPHSWAVSWWPGLTCPFVSAFTLGGRIHDPGQLKSRHVVLLCLRGGVISKLDNMPACFETDEHIMLPWCRGYHVCFTRKRSAVQFCLEVLSEMYVVVFSARGIRDMFEIQLSLVTGGHFGRRLFVLLTGVKMT